MRLLPIVLSLLLCSPLLAELKVVEKQLKDGMKWETRVTAEVEIDPLEVTTLGQKVSGAFTRNSRLTYQVVVGEESIAVRVKAHKLEINGKERESDFEEQEGAFEWLESQYTPADFDGAEASPVELKWVNWMSTRLNNWNYNFLLGDAKQREVGETWDLQSEDLFLEGFPGGVFGGKIQVSYLRDSETDGVLCAELEVMMDLEGKLRSGRSGQAKMKGVGKMYCDPSTGLVRLSTYDGTYTMDIPESEASAGFGKSSHRFTITEQATPIQDDDKKAGKDLE